MTSVNVDRKFAELTERERLVPVANELSRKLSAIFQMSDENFQPIDHEPKLLLACMPKSGSTWMTTLLEETLNLAPIRCYLEPDRNEQEIDSLALFQSWGRRALFVQQHIRYSRTLMRLCRGFSTKVVVLTRRLDDVVVSLCDHILSESPVFAMSYMEAKWFNRKSQKEQFDFLIDHTMPWYFNFFVGWQRAIRNDKEHIIQVCYEDLIRDTASCIERVATFYGASVANLLSQQLDKRNATRYNQGRAGRGKEVLTTAQRARLRRLANHYPDCDFKSVGL